MNCFDCALDETVTPAVAVCHDCGVGVCIGHAVACEHHLTRTATINRIIIVEPPARLVRCGICTAANNSAHQDAEPTRRHAERHARR